MEKIININFQGRVIPIEEPAYETLKQYTETLRRHFAREESGDEIISDIENRIAELLAAKLKQGANCINNTDLNVVIDSIGRLEDIDGADEPEQDNTQKQEQRQEQTQQGAYNYRQPNSRERFYRNADDKVIAGVCSGIATRLGVDPVAVRIIFVVLSGALFWIYILLWLIVPSQSVQSHITRRLFRNPDDKVIAGVCGGLAEYLGMDTWKLRLIFIFPLVMGMISKGLHWYVWQWHWHWGPGFFIGSLSSTLFLLYVILWIAIPYASSATDRMEMRGEKIDLNSIKAATQARAGVPVDHRRSEGSGLGRIIGILFKAFFLFVGGVVALSLFGVLIGLVFAGTATIPFTDFVFSSWKEYAIAWTSVALTLGIPMLALIVWIIRRLMGVRSRRHYLGYVFTGLWFIGLTCAVTLVGMQLRNFTTKSLVEDVCTIQQPPTGKLYVNVNNQGPWHSRHGHWFGEWDEDDAPMHIVSNDSLWLNTVRINVEPSKDSLYHVYKTRMSRANTTQEAKVLASHIQFDVASHDSIISLPKGFTIYNKDKFRNQQVLVTIEVPMSKKIQFARDVDDYSWYNIRSSGHGVYYEHDWNDYDDYDTEKEYIMTATGLKRVTDTSSHQRHTEEDDNQ